MPFLTVWVNPLTCLDIDFPQPGAPTPTAERLLDYLFAPDVERTMEGFVLRYRELLSDAPIAQLAPAQAPILQKLVWPLKQAIGSYCLGDYLAVVALCGLVGEMAAMLLWEISDGPNRSITEEVRKLLRGDSFEKAGQEARVDVLKTLRLIESDTKGAFSTMRTIRREYLHFLSKSHEALRTDARRAFLAATNAIAFVLGVSFPSPGVVAFRPELIAYLNAKSAEER